MKKKSIASPDLKAKWWVPYIVSLPLKEFQIVFNNSDKMTNKKKCSSSKISYFIFPPFSFNNVCLRKIICLIQVLL